MSLPCLRRVLRAEADDLASQLGQALAQRKVAQEEKSALLQRMSSRWARAHKCVYVCVCMSARALAA